MIYMGKWNKIYNFIRTGRLISHQIFIKFHTLIYNNLF